MKRVLVVDDFPHLRDTLTELLQYNGYEVMTAGDGEVAIEMAVRYLPDLVLCDINMPEKNGYEVMIALANNPLTAHIPMVMLTGDTDQLRDQYELRENVMGMIIKPFETFTLLNMLHQCLTAV